MATGAYTLPQGIAIDGQTHQAVPRKTGAYDTEAQLLGVPPLFVAQLIYFQNSTQFAAGAALAAGAQKLYGRDTNLTSRTGGMAKGERLYAYGITAKIDTYAVAHVLNTLANSAMFDMWRQIWAVADVAINLGPDEFIRCQARDIPVHAPKNPQITTTVGASTMLVDDISSDGMFDLCIAGDPYVFDQQEDFRLNLNFAPIAFTLLVDTYVTFRLEGIRLKSLRQ